MRGLLIRLIITAIGLWFASGIVGGMHIDGPGTLLLAAFLLGVVNAVIRPVLIVLTLPITVLTLGLFLLVVNAATLGLVAWLLPGFWIDGLGPAVLGAIIVTITGWIGNAFVGPHGRFEVMVIRRRHE